MAWAYTFRNLLGWLAWWGWVGLLAGQQVSLAPKPRIPIHGPIDNSCIQGGLVLARIYRRESEYRYRVQIEYALDMRYQGSTVRVEPVRLGALLVFSRNKASNGRATLPKVGDLWLIEQGRVGAIPGPRSYGDPDLRPYYHSQGIDYQISMSAGLWGQPWDRPPTGLIAQPADPWDRWSLVFAKAQENLALLMEQRIRDPVGRGLSQALLLGWKAELDPTTKIAFQQSGTVHLLAVSGMHVLFIHGWVLLVLGWLYQRLGQRGNAPIPPPLLRFLGTSLPVLMYCWLTGGASSAWRAGLVVAWMEGTRAKAGSHHGGLALFQAAACMLALDSNAWKDPGFILSFGAVVGLQWLYRPLAQRLFSSETKSLVTKIVLNGLLTICAQLITAPITIFYFKQFPTYFLPANLLVVPLSGPLLLLALGWSLTGEVPIVGNIADTLGHLLFGFTQSVTNFWGGLPGAVLHRPDFDGFDAVWMSGLVGLLMVGVQVSREVQVRRLGLWGLIMALGWQVSCQYRNGNRESRRLWTYQPVGAAWALWSRQGQGVKAWSNAEGAHQQVLLRRMEPYGTTDFQTIPQAVGVGLKSWVNCPSLVLQFGTQEPCFWDRAKDMPPHQTLLAWGRLEVNLLQKVDLLILHQGAKAVWTPRTQPDFIVFGGYAKVDDDPEPLRKCLQDGVPYYDLRIHPPP